MMIERLDRLHEESRHMDIYEELANANKDSEPEILWRFARACYYLAYPLEQKNPQKRKLLDEGFTHASNAYKLEENSFDVVKCFAAITGTRTDFLGTKERIEQGNAFKELLDKALAMCPDDYELLHMRARFAFSVASLSWFERKAAQALYAKPPDATYDDAIQDFLAVLELQPDWLDNLFFLAKAYLAKGDKESGVKYLRRAIDSFQQDENQPAPEMLAEAKALLKKHDK